jgi:hypothetical protein
VSEIQSEDYCSNDEEQSEDLGAHESYDLEAYMSGPDSQDDDESVESGSVRSPQGCKIEYDYFDAGKLLFKVLEEEV